MKKTVKILLFTLIIAALALTPGTEGQASTIISGSVITNGGNGGTASLSKTSLKMAPATYKALKVSNAPGKITWSTSNKKVATVTSTGVVYAQAKGTATITAKAKGMKKLTCKVTVKYSTKTLKDGITYKDAKGTYSLTGRWYKRNLGSTSYNFTNNLGSCIYFKVTGTKKVTMYMGYLCNQTGDAPWISYSIDGKTLKSIRAAEKVVINLGNTKTHYVKVVYERSNPYESRWDSNCGLAIKNIKANTTSTGVISAIVPQNPKVVFYGDSITEGVRTIGSTLDTNGTSVTHAYSWYTASYLNAVPYIVGYASSGITETGSFNTALNTVSYFANGVKADSYPTDVGAVVIEYGANDVNCSSTDFINGYVSLIKKIHKAYPSAKIIAMGTPLSHNRNAENIKAAADKYSYCYYLDTYSLGISSYDNIHPNDEGSQKIAKALAKLINKKTSYYK